MENLCNNPDMADLHIQVHSAVNNIKVHTAVNNQQFLFGITIAILLPTTSWSKVVRFPNPLDISSQAGTMSSLRSPQIYILKIYTGPKFTQTQIYMGPIFTQPRFAQTHFHT